MNDYNTDQNMNKDNMNRDDMNREDTTMERDNTSMDSDTGTKGGTATTDQSNMQDTEDMDADLGIGAFEDTEDIDTL